MSDQTTLINIRCENEATDEAFSVRVKPRDVLAWEREKGNGRGLSDLSSAKMTDIYGIAYYVLIRLQKFVGNRPEFERTWDVIPETDGDDDSEGSDTP